MLLSPLSQIIHAMQVRNFIYIFQVLLTEFNGNELNNRTFGKLSL